MNAILIPDHNCHRRGVLLLKDGVLLTTNGLRVDDLSLPCEAISYDDRQKAEREFVDSVRAGIYPQADAPAIVFTGTRVHVVRDGEGVSIRPT